MPYVDSSQDNRAELEPHCGRDAMNAGELNFQITCLVDGYLAGALDYQGINDVVGALEGAKLEVYRRLAAPYEDMKMSVTGDVYVTTIPTPGARKVSS